MVNTIIDLTVTFDSDGDITITYSADNPEYAYEGYWSDYEKRAFTDVKAPITVQSAAAAYELLRANDKPEIFIQPVYTTTFVQKVVRDMGLDS